MIPVIDIELSWGTWINGMLFETKGIIQAHDCTELILSIWEL